MSVGYQGMGMGWGMALSNLVFLLLLLLLFLLLLLLLTLLGPHKAVAVEPAEKTRKGDAHGCASFSTGQGRPVEKF